MAAIGQIAPLLSTISDTIYLKIIRLYLFLKFSSKTERNTFKIDREIYIYHNSIFIDFLFESIILFFINLKIKQAPSVG
jgi:hypothetical protein